nr:ATP-binding protein [Mariniradius sediminis]
MADIYLLDVTKTERTSDRDSTLEATLSSAKSRLEWLKENAADTAEYHTFEQVGLNIAEIMVVYAGLEEVRYILTNRNFSEEALKNIELRTKRQQELNELEFLSRVKTKQKSENSGNKSFGNEDPLSDFSARNELDVQEELMEIVREIQSGNSASGNLKARSDSAIQSIRAVVEEIYEDEKRQQSNFITLESRLIEKNKEIYSQIQGAISTLQQNLLTEYNDQNQSAYRLTYTVSIVLGFLVFLGVVGSLGFIFSILKEVNQANTYREKLEEAKKKSDQLAKAKQDFLANMSHEIRNPLHAIQGYQRALDQSGLNAQQKEFVEMIGFASRTLISIVNDILDFSKLEAGQINIERAAFEPVKLFLSLKSFYDFKAEEKKLDFKWQIDLPGGKWLMGDQLRLNQILNNLLSNSFKFTSEGSIKVHIGFEEEKLILEVADTGMGMGPEVKENLFKEFNQGDASITRKFGGTGLGLAIIRKLIDRLGGTVDVWSEIGVGTTVTVKLPFEVVDPVEKEFSQEVNYDLSGLNVLVVDDDTVGLRLMRLLLESAGATVLDFAGGLSWRENFKQVPLDLAILDIQMPEVSGLDVLKALKSNKKYKKLPVLAMTANVFANEKNSLGEQGFDGVVLKPFDEKSLFREIDKQLIINKKITISDRSFKENAADKTQFFDLKDIRKFCLGDEQLMQEVIHDLIQNTTTDLDTLREALATADYSKIREICHQLASRLAQIKAPFSGDIREIELAISENRIEGLDRKLEEIFPGIEHLIAQLHAKYPEAIGK